MMMLVFVTLSTDVSRSVIMNLIIEGANCVGCIWCDLVEMCCYDKRVIVYLFVKRKAEILHLFETHRRAAPGSGLRVSGSLVWCPVVIKSLQFIHSPTFHV